MSASTALLLRGNGADGGTTFRDEIGHAVTAYGNVKTSTAQSKFNGSSIEFDGNGDYLSMSHAADFLPTSGDMTVEAFFYKRSHGSANYFALFHLSSGSTFGRLTTVNSTGFTFDDGAVGWSVSASISLNAWHHAAFVIHNGVRLVFLDGSLVGSSPVPTSSEWNAATTIASIGHQIGAPSPVSDLDGFIQDFNYIPGYAKYTANFTPPTRPVSRYTEFQHSRVILALHADRKHGSTVAIDQSGTKKQFKFHGNAKITSAVKRVGRGSFAFDGYMDGISATYKDFAFGRKPFTIEMWYRTNKNSLNGQVLVDMRTADPQVNACLYLASGAPTIHMNGATVISGSAQPEGSWNHVALCKSGGILRMFVNGVKTGADYSDSNNYLSDTMFIGMSFDGTSSINGNIDEVIVTDYPKYTTGFTVPPIPFARQAFALNVEPLFVGGSTFAEASGKAVTNVGVTADAYNVPCSECYRHVSLLNFRGANGSTSFYDEGGLKWTPSGASIVANSPAGGRQNWGAGYFDGSSQVVSEATDRFSFGLRDFCVETTVYFEATTGSSEIIFSGGAGNVAIFRRPDGRIGVDQDSVTGVLVGSRTVSNGSRHDIAIVRQDGVASLYIDGDLDASATSLHNFYGTGSAYIGGVGGGYLNGYILEISSISGSPKYTGPYTPLGGYQDFLGDVRVNEFGLTSGKFNGSSYASLGSSTDFDLGADDMTAEAWVYINGNSSPDIDGSRNVAIIDTWPSSSIVGWSFQLRGTSSATGTSIALDSWAGPGVGTQSTFPTFISHGRWHHIAVTVSGGVRRAFLNGKEVSGATTNIGGGAAALNSNGNGVRIGGSLNTSYPRKLNGNIYGARLVKGFAKYTSDFIPPASPPNPHCAVGLHFEGADGSSTFTEVNGKSISSSGATISTSDKAIGESCGVFNGSSYLSVPYDSKMAIGSRNFMIETFIKVTSLPGLVSEIASDNSPSTNGQWMIRLGSDGMFNFSMSSTVTGGTFYTVASPVGSISAGQWYHIRVIRNGVWLAIFRDGELVGLNEVPAGHAPYNPAYSLQLGRNNTNSDWYFNGKLDEFQLSFGDYPVESFTPPAAPFESTGLPSALYVSFDERSQSDTVSNDDNHEVSVYDVTTRTGHYRLGAEAAYLNGYSSRIEYGQSTDFLMTGDFRVTTWIKPFQQAGAYPVIVAAANGAGAGHVETQFGYSNAAYSGMYSFKPYLNGSVSSIALTPNEWNYLELSRINGTVRIFVNGVVGAAYGDGRWFDFSGGGLRIGGNTRDGANSYIKAMIADLEIVKDCGGHVANYTPPTRRMLFRESGRQGVYDFGINEAGTMWPLNDNQYSRGPVTMVDGVAYQDELYDWIESNGVYQVVGDAVSPSEISPDLFFRPNRNQNGYDGVIFGGNSSYIKSPKIPAFEDLSGGYSIEFVMDPASKPYYANIINIGRGARSGTHSGSIVIEAGDTNEASSSLSFQHYNGVTSTPRLIAPLAYQSFGGLRYVIITHDPVTTARKIYINGALVAMDLVALPDNDATRNRVLLGAWPADVSAKYTGFLSSVAIYDYALTEQQIDEASRIFLGQVKPVSVYENLMAQDVMDAIIKSVTIVFEAVSETVSATCSADSIVSVFYIYYETVAETLGISTEAIYPRKYFEAVYEAAMLTDSSTCLRVLLASIVEALVKTSSASAAKGFVETVNETVASSTSYLLSMIATVVEDIDLRDNLIGFAELIVAITESMSVTSSAVANRAVLAAVMESTEFSDEVTQNGLLQEMIREGFSMTLVQANGSEQWSGFAVNTNTSATSIYEGFRFNSYAKVGEHYYGASDTGIYRIGESETDEGEMINAIVTTGLINLGTSARKGIDNAFIIMRNDGDCFLRVLADGQEYSYKMMHERDGKFEGSRVKIGKGLRAVTWQFEIYNSDGADFDIDGAVIYPLVLSRHV